MPLQHGARLGPYVVLEKLGEGLMGNVYKARDARLDRLVAIKRSAKEFSDRFEREARAAAALNRFTRSIIFRLILRCFACSSTTVRCQLAED